VWCGDEIRGVANEAARPGHGGADQVRSTELPMPRPVSPAISSTFATWTRIYKRRITYPDEWFQV
jgi:hypothetical protein